MTILTSKNESFCEFLNSMLSQRDVISDVCLLLWCEMGSGSLHIGMDNFGLALKRVCGVAMSNVHHKANPPSRTLINPN